MQRNDAKCEKIVCLMQNIAQGQLDMEGALTARDHVGIQDFVLLDETTELAFLNNLKKRFSKDLIYVSFAPFPALCTVECEQDKELFYFYFLPIWFRLTSALC